MKGERQEGAYASLGFQFAAGILLFGGAGYGLDRWLGTLPWGTVVGTLVGAVLSFLVVYRQLMGGGKAGGREGGKR